MTPVIVFDQFEEIFTVGQETEASRARSAAFLTELGDWVENRPPEAVRVALEDEPTAARLFDFKRSTAKLALSFREDFLAEMEDLKEQMPSLMYNRFRLLAMSGGQAYEVITRAGGQLVDDDVARRILRLAWKNEPSPPIDRPDFPKIEIDPALLSVVCSELNHKRRQESPPLPRITPALLENADREILSGFYERSVDDLDPHVRAFVEDELITDRGYRDSHALDDALALTGVTSEALDLLIRRRLLRMDERHSVRRLELTHDVLTQVVKESRDNRRAREAEETALAQQRRNRRHAALVAAGTFVAFVLVALAGWSWWKSERLLREATITRLVAYGDQLENVEYDAALLVSLEAVRIVPTDETRAGLVHRFESHPQLAAFLPGHEDAVWGISFSPEGKRLASASLDGTVRLWDVPNLKLLAALQGRSSINDVAISPDGKLLATANRDKEVTLWDLETYRSIAQLSGHKDAVFSVAFSADGKRLASASRDRTVILWDVETRKRLGAPLAHKGEVYGVAFSPDGKRLAAANKDKAVMLWDVESHQPLAQLQGHDDAVFSVAFSPDGKRLASAGKDQDILLWTLDDFKPLARLKGHEDIVFGIAFSRNGTLASASQDKAVVVWDLEGGKPTARLNGHKGGVESVAFSPDGKLLASAGDDKTVILWDLDGRRRLAALRTGDIKVLTAEVCRTAHRNLSCEEWRRYIGSARPYRKTCEALPGPEKCD